MNMVLNFLSEKLGKEFDEDGKFARTGKVIPGKIEALKTLEYFSVSGAKSLGKEWIYGKFIPEIMKGQNNSIEDLLATTLEFASEMISKIVIENYKGKKSKMLVTGGGAFNKYFIQLLQERLTEKCEIIIPDSLIVKYKEALIFAFLGVLRWNNKINCLKSSTGASRDNIGGVIVAG